MTSINGSDTTSELIHYVARYGGFCRDCADNDGTCPLSGMPCDPKQQAAVIKHTINALKYGIEHGFIRNPFTRAAPALARWKHCEYPNQHKMIEHKDGEYVLFADVMTLMRETKGDQTEKIRKSIALCDPNNGTHCGDVPELLTVAWQLCDDKFNPDDKLTYKKPIIPRNGDVQLVDRTQVTEIIAAIRAEATCAHDADAKAFLSANSRAEVAETDLVQTKAALSDPFAVLIMMMRGEIAKPEFDSLQRVYPEMGVRMAELALLRQGVKLRRALEDVLAHLKQHVDVSEETKGDYDSPLAAYDRGVAVLAETEPTERLGRLEEKSL